MSKNLTFKLIMDADSKGFVSGVKQSESVAKSVFDAIKTESDKLKQSSAEASKELGNIIPKGTSELAANLTKSLSSATEIIKGAGENAKSTADNFTDFGNKSHKALDLLKSDLTSAKQKLQEFANSNASPADIEVAQRQVDQLEKEVQQADEAFNDFQAEVGRANTQLKETDSAATSAKKGLDGAKFAVNALVGAMAALGVGLGLRELAEAADVYTGLSARIQIATKEGGNFESAMAGVHQVALSTNSSLQATGDLFTRIDAVGKQMGMTQQQALDLTKTVTQAIQIGGGSAQASEAAITQFIQAMQGGVLRGEEFNSIMENGYGLAEALAKGLGVTTGELRKMAENGELTSERVAKALQSQAAQVQSTYDQFPTTIGNSLQRIQTQWQILIGTMDQANGASATVAEWLVMLADNMGIVESLIDDLGDGFVWVGDQLKKIDPSVWVSLKNALSSAYDAIKDIVAMLADDFTRTVDILNTGLSTALSVLSSLTGEVTEAGEQVSFLERVLQGLSIAFGFISDGAAAIKIGVNLLTGAFFDLASAANSVLAALTWGDLSKQFAANADLMKQKAKEYYAEADRDAQGFHSKGLQRLDEASKTQAEKDAETVASSKAKLEQLLADQTAEVEGKKVSEQEKLKAVQDYAEAAIRANGGVMDGVMQADLLTKGYIVTIDKAGKVSVQAGQSAEQAAESAARKEEALKLAKENVKKADEEYLAYQKHAAAERALLEQQIEQAKKTGDLNALASAQASLAAINAKEAELAKNRELRIAELNKANIGSGQVAETAYSRASEAAKLFGVDLDASLNKVSKAFSSSGNDLDNLKTRLAEAGITGKQAGDVLYQAWEDWLSKARSQAEIDAANAKMREFEAQGVFSTKQVELGIMAIRNANANIPGELDETGKAFERLGIKTKEQLRLSAQMALADFETVRQSGQATQADLQKAYEKTIQLAYASGDAQIIAAANAKAASLGLSIQVSETGQVSVRANNAVEESLHRVRNATGYAGDGFDELGRRGVRAGNDTADAWEEARRAAEAAFAPVGKMKASRTGTTAKHGLSVEEIEQMLVEIGYEGDTKKKAQQLFRDAEPVAGGYYKSASDKWMKDNYGVSAYDNRKALGNAMYVMEQLEILEQYVGKTGSFKMNGNINMNDYAPSIPSVPLVRDIDSSPKTTIRIEAANGQYVDAQVDANQVNPLTEILRQLGTIKKST
nr:tape measure protein [Acinetobacter indicus]